MNTKPSLIHRAWQASKHRLAQGLSITVLALAPLMSAQAAVAVDQSPLILQKPLPPNIVLMLDDSGSLSWDYMPDFGFLNNNSDNDALIDSANNGVYYNPTITYIPPVTVSGTNYPTYTDMTNAPADGFGTVYPTSDTVDLTNYDGSTYDTGQINYSSSSSYSTTYTSISSSFACKTLKNQTGGDSYSYSSSKKTCKVTYTTGLFQYSTGPAAGPYTVHYVAATSCGSIANCVTASDTSGTSAPAGIAAGTNIANWFAYYHIRMLTAKTGLTLAFSSLDPSYRFGFGSIDGNNNSNLSSTTGLYNYYDSYNQQTNSIAQVAPFGDGSAGTQKANFWNWITSEYASNGTPLRQALNQVGKYYQSSQPWLTGGTGTDANTSYACRPSYTILTTDGFWNDSSPGVGNVDNTKGTAITAPSAYQYIPTAPFSDSYSNTLADVAMKYWETDLQPGLANEVPTTPNDPAYWQHMTTFTMGLGWDPTPLLTKGTGGQTLTVPDVFTWARTGTPPAGFASTSNIWPQPSANSINNIGDLAHAAVNGHGNFFSVKSPSDMINGLKSALAAIADRQGAGNAITLSGNTLPTTSSSTNPFYQFRATYYTGQWTGALTAQTYDTTTTPASYTPDWSTNSLAASFSTVSGVSLSNRNVWTTKTGSGGSGSVAFRQASNLTSAQQTGLGAYSVSTVNAQTMLNYLLGDSTYAVGNPGGTLRARKALLGDIVSSTPVYVAMPDAGLFANATFTGASSYAAFVSSEASRDPMVYVTANDGMLHAFRVDAGAGWQLSGSSVNTVSSQAAGTEVYAYMPSAVLTQTGASSITNLANPQYGVVDAVNATQPVPHQYYNDGRITVQNVYFSNSWHTVLVGTTGRGPAKAIYALDITDPTVLMNPATAKNALLWERSAGDGKTGSGYIGEMTGAPVIAQVKNGNQTSWAVLVGNGYNSANNTAALLQFDLQTGSLTVHTAGTATNNGLAEPGLMQGNTANGISTYAFAGDLNGNLWKFDLSSNNSSGTVAFTAKDPSGVAQPITSLVSLAYDGTTNSTFALFGTGKYLTQTDTQSSQVQTWYGIRVGINADLSGAATTAMPIADSSTTRSDLTQRYITDLANGYRATSLQDGNDMNNKDGWFMDLSTQTGERIVNRTQFIGGKAVVSTLIPKVNDPCNTVPAGAVMGVDPFTGANQASDYGLGTTSISYKGANGQTINATVAINGQVFSAGPAAGVTAVTNADGTVSISFNTMGGGLAGLGPIRLGGSAASRLSWRELTN